MLRYAGPSWTPSWALGGPLGAILGQKGRSDTFPPPPSSPRGGVGQGEEEVLAERRHNSLNQLRPEGWWDLCCGLLRSDAWIRRRTLEEEAAGVKRQGWYCFCGTKYRPKMGLIMELVDTKRKMAIYLRMPHPTTD
eukprot:4405593-Pyramimonas_sp.AAC.1